MYFVSGTRDERYVQGLDSDRKTLTWVHKRDYLESKLGTYVHKLLYLKMLGKCFSNGNIFIFNEI